MGLFERYLSVWVVLCIVAGILLGNAMPSLFQGIAQFEFAHVNLVVAALCGLVCAAVRVSSRKDHQ